AWCYRCYKRCPQGQRLPEIFLSLRTIANERGHTEPFENAIGKIVENIPLPIVTTFVCFHPERAGLDLEKVTSKIERMYEEYLEEEKERMGERRSLGKVAVIGSGPSGLTVAYELSRKGLDVTIYESLLEPGGMLRKCIPEYRLPSSALKREIQLLEDIGVQIKNGLTIGEDLSFKDLWRAGHKAIFIGAGAHRSRIIGIEGTELEGVIHAVDYLWGVNSGEVGEGGEDVVVIGGGNVAVDAARTALRLGAENVTILYRRSREEMPAIPWEVGEAEEEGVKIEFLASPTRILGENGRVSGIECVRMQLGEIDESGRRRPSPVEGSEFTLEKDMVILAIGEAPDLGFLPEEIELEENGSVWVNPITMETSLKGVFAGGDAVTGPATVIEAIRAGKCAAESIFGYIRSLGGW
ncbi:MAG: FAD-dependent oxidoreductase, partial [Candidatus Bathyarchaeota archaeon]